MWIIILVIILVTIGIALAIPLAVLIVSSQDKAKKEAKKILETGRIDDSKKFEQVSKTLATTQNDLEAADLWKKLQDLKDKKVNVLTT